MVSVWLKPVTRRRGPRSAPADRSAQADFLTRDPRGGQLPDYLVALGEEMMRDQTRLMEDMEVMNRHIEHIRRPAEP